MNRRDFLSLAGLLSAGGWLPSVCGAQRLPLTVAPRARRGLLILLELQGGNDGLNTVIPYADPLYYRLRPTLGIARERVLQLDEHQGLHPSLRALWPAWQAGQLAVIQGLGYPEPNLSHFRSMEIWDTASSSDAYLRQGWLARAFMQGGARRGETAGLATGSMVLGSAELGPLALGARSSATAAGGPGAFQDSVKTALQALAVAGASPAHGMMVLRLTLHGFDTHENQAVRHADLLQQLAMGIATLRSTLIALGRWNSALIMTYSEFGRQARENHSGGTEHGTLAPHFLVGGRVRGGLFGMPVELGRDAAGSLRSGIDFRRLYATVLEPWWGLDAPRILQGRFEALPILRA